MAQEISWDSIPQTSQSSASGSSKNTELYMKLEKPRHTVRLVGQIIKIYTYWDGSARRKYTIPADYVERMRNAGLRPDEKFAVLCFDRDDDKLRLKILERGRSIFKFFGAYYEESKNAPGGAKGPNWLIKMDSKAERNRDYTVMAIAEAPFTKEELAFINQDPETEENKEKPLGEKGFFKVLDYYNRLEERSREALEELLSKQAKENISDSSQSVEDVVARSTRGSSIEDIVGSGAGISPSTNAGDDDLPF